MASVSAPSDKCSSSDSVQDESPVLVDDEYVFHPLSVFESQLLSDDHNLSFSQDNNPPAVVLDECVYVRDDYPSFRATNGQLWKYSMISKSLDIIPTPKGVVRHYGLAVWSEKLVLVGGQSNDGQKSSFNVWVHQGSRWSYKIIPPVPVERVQLNPNGSILSAAGHEALLFTMYTWYNSLNETHIALFRYDAKMKCWGQPSKWLKFDGRLYLVKANLLVHSATLYAMIQQFPNTKSMIYYAHISSSAEEHKFDPLCVSCDKFISDRARFITLGDKVIVADHDGRKIKLYTTFKDEKKKLSLVEIDDLNIEYESIFSIVGFERSLLIIGRESESSKCVATVRKFDSNVSPYNPNDHFTIKAIKKLERAANIPVLTDEDLISKLGAIKTYCGFKLHCCLDECRSVVVRYMHSWLVEYRCNTSIAEPTWSKFLEALKCVELFELETQVRECLESAPKVEHCKPKEATGIEELQKHEAKLKLLHDRLKSESDPQQVKKNVDWCYRQCCTASHKIKQEQSTLRDNIDQLEEENDQLVKVNNQLVKVNSQLKQDLSQLKEEMDSLEKKLAERDQPPAKRHCLDGEGASPTLAKLSYWRTPMGKICIIKKIAPNWEKLGVLLDFDPSGAQLAIIHKKYHSDPEACCQAMFQHWLEGNGVRRCSWHTLIELLEECDQEALAKEIEEALTNN